MRIISNNKTDDYSNYLDRKKGIINYNNSLISKPKVYNQKTNNLTINGKNKIVKYKSYELLNNVKNIKPYFNNNCFPNNNNPTQTLNLTEGKISNFNMKNIIINTEMFNDTSCNSDYIFGNNISNLTYNIQNNYVSDNCILNYILKNLGFPICPTDINIINNKFNMISLYGENSNTFVDRDGKLLFSNLKKYNMPVKFGFTLSGGGLPLSEVKQYNRITLSISNENINQKYFTNQIFTSSWNSSDIAFSNQQLNFTEQSNNIIFPEFYYEIYDYFMELEGKGCIRKKQIAGTNNPLIDLSFTTPVPTREQVNPNNYNILLNEIDTQILDYELSNNSLIDFSYHNLTWKDDGKSYNVIFAKNNINLELSDNILSFVILKDYKIYLGKTGNLDDPNVGKDLSGNLCYFSHNILANDDIVIFSLSSEYITGYDSNFYNQYNNDIIITDENENFYYNFIKISPSIDIAIDPNNIEYSDQVRIQKIKGYYLGLDISNIILPPVEIKYLKLNDISYENNDNKFSIHIRQHFVNPDSDISLSKQIDFIVNKYPEQKIDIDSNISFLSYNFINLNYLNYFFGINFIDLNDVYLELNYHVSLDNLISQWIFNDNLGKIDISINFIFNNTVIDSFPNIRTISLDSKQLYDSSYINYDISSVFNIGNLKNIINENNSFSLDVSSIINLFEHPIYDFNNQIKIINYSTSKTILNTDLDINIIFNNFKHLFERNFREKDNLDYNDLSVVLQLCNSGIYNITNDGSYVNWSEFSNNYNQSISLNKGQLLWDNYAFITKNSVILDSQIQYIDYSNYFGNNDKNYKSLENSGNLIISHIIDNYWNKEELLNFESPRNTENYKFITLKINLKEEALYLSNNILINCWKRNTYNTYNKLTLVDEFILYVCEENNYYDLSNSGYQGYSAWMNAAKEYDTQSFIASVKNGGGCYNPYEDYYKDKDTNEYELYIPLLNSRSSTAIYLKIGLPIDSLNNIARVNYKLPEYIEE